MRSKNKKKNLPWKTGWFNRTDERDQDSGRVFQIEIWNMSNISLLENLDTKCMVHLPTFTIKIAKCRWIYHTLSIWERKNTSELLQDFLWKCNSLGLTIGKFRNETLSASGLSGLQRREGWQRCTAIDIGSNKKKTRNIGQNVTGKYHGQIGWHREGLVMNFQKDLVVDCKNNYRLCTHRLMLYSAFIYLYMGARCTFLAPPPPPPPWYGPPPYPAPYPIVLAATVVVLVLVLPITSTT